MFAIYKRELKSMFSGMIGYLFLAVMLCIFGFFYTIYNLMYYQVGSLEYTLGVNGFGLIIMILCFAILSMRIFSDERKNKTDQLLLTAPVKVFDIVMGKYLALLSVFAIAILILLVYFGILGFFGTIYINESLIALLGFFLYGAMCLSIGLLISTLFENNVVSAVLSFVAMFLTYFMGNIIDAVSGLGDWLSSVLGTLYGLDKMLDFFGGQFNICSVVYFVTFIALMLFLTCQAILKRRYTVSSKNLSFGAYSGAMVLIAILLTIGLNIVLTKLPEEYTNFDLSTNHLYALTDETEDMLDTLDEDITIVVLYADEESYDSVVVNYLRQYKKNDHITIKYIDPMINPKYYTQFTDTAPSTGSLIVLTDKKSKVIDYSDLFEYEYSFDYSTYNYSTTLTGYDIEGQVTSAISYVISDENAKFYVLEGHQETALEDDFTAAMTKANIDYETINLMNYEAVPEDADCLIINAPADDFSEADAQKVIDYITGGGNLIVTTLPDAASSIMPNFASILAAYGVSVDNALILESDSTMYMAGSGGAQLYLLPNVLSTDIGSTMSGKYVLMYYSCPIESGADEAAGEVSYTKLLTTSSSAYAISLESLNERESLDQAEGDIAGSFAVGLKAALTVSGDSDGESVLYILSSPLAFSSSASSYVSGGNLKYFSCMIASYNENTVSIPVKSFDYEYLVIPSMASMILGLLTVIIIPLGLLTAGIIISVRRRKR